MHRFFINKEDKYGQEISLVGENAVHAHVLRLRLGEEIYTVVGLIEQDMPPAVWLHYHSNVQINQLLITPHSPLREVVVRQMLAGIDYNAIVDIDRFVTSIAMRNILLILIVLALASLIFMVRAFRDRRIVDILLVVIIMAGIVVGVQEILGMMPSMVDSPPLRGIFFAQMPHGQFSLGIMRLKEYNERATIAFIAGLVSIACLVLTLDVFQRRTT